MRGFGGVLRLGMVVVVLTIAPWSSAGAVMVAGKHVGVELVADTARAAPGSTFRLGVRFVPEDEWHVYWRNPGDSGEAPRIEWMLPAGLTAGALEWPLPDRIPVGPLVNFGYAGEMLLAAPVSVARDVDTAAPLALRAQVKWLVCDRDECIPGGATLALTLPFGGAGTIAPATARLFETARRRVPSAPPPTWRVSATRDGDRVTLAVAGAPLAGAGASLAGAGTPNAADTTPFFFAADREALEPSAAQAVTRANDGFRLTLTPRTTAPATLAGVLRIGDAGYDIAAPVAGAGAAGGTGVAIQSAPATNAASAGDGAEPARAAAGSDGVAAMPLLLAFAGGLLLNLMPCVFPVLALKALALAGLGGEARRMVRRHGIVYAAGIVVSFWLLAGALLALRAGGAELGWGFQLQSPTVIAALAGLFFWMALVLLDVVAIGGAIMGVGQHLTAGDGDRAAFFTGVLATVVATPCTAPFMGTAIGYALGQPPVVALAVFTSLGLGLAFPYVLITVVPTLAGLLPRPGAWMETLKQLLAFPLLATVVWLIWVASFQAGPQAVGAILMGLVLIAFAAWVAGRFSGLGARLVASTAVGVALLLGGTITPVDHPAPRASTAVAHAGAHGDRATGADADLAWEPFSTARIAELRAAGRPVFVDFTAAWCVTCQVNKKVALETAEVIAKMKELGVVALRADWTRPDAEITRALQEFGRDGVPLYVLYSGRQNEPPTILPQILTPAIVITELDKLEPTEIRRSST